MSEKELLPADGTVVNQETDVEKLLRENESLITSLARKMQRPDLGLDIEELIGIGRLAAVRAAQRWSTMGFVGNFTNYLNGAIRNAFADAFNRKGLDDIHLEDSVGDGSSTFGETLAGEIVADPEEMLIRSLTVKAVREAIETISQRQREVVVLSMQGYNYSEIAGRLGITEAAVKSRMFDAYRNLRKILSNHPALVS